MVVLSQVRIHHPRLMLKCAIGSLELKAHTYAKEWFTISCLLMMSCLYGGMGIQENNSCNTFDIIYRYTQRLDRGGEETVPCLFCIIV